MENSNETLLILLAKESMEVRTPISDQESKKEINPQHEGQEKQSRECERLSMGQSCNMEKPAKSGHLNKL
jgi:hypothetical protein